MSVTILDANTLYNMFVNGYRRLALAEQQVNELNVFPVPDGDTGTNMTKTLSGGVSSVSPDNLNISQMMSQFSKAVLLSARGNSGVILSQFIKGISVSTEGKDILEVHDFTDIIHSGMEYSYNAVSNPVEGTMLTVIREAYEAVSNKQFSDFDAAFSDYLSEMKTSLSNTPSKLPALKEAGVVDSGGMGLVYIFEGMNSYLKGEILTADSKLDNSDIIPVNVKKFGPDSHLEYGYCTEFILQLMNYKTNIAAFSSKAAIDYLETIGNSIVAVQDEDIFKVHIHTFTPEKVLAFARTYGEFISVKIENMSLQHNESATDLTDKSERIKYAVVTVASGSGIIDYFSEIGAHRVIDGGQTQNPSAKDFIDAFETINAEYIIVLPNNSNIILTAHQAAQMYTKSSVHVIETKSIAEGYSALSMMNTWADDIESFISDMESGLKNVTTLNITTAISDALINNINIKKNMFIAIADGDIIHSSTDRTQVIMDSILKMNNITSKEVVTIFYGESVTEQECEQLIEKITSDYPHLECGAVYGGQSIYDYYIAFE